MIEKKVYLSYIMKKYEVDILGEKKKILKEKYFWVTVTLTLLGILFVSIAENDKFATIVGDTINSIIKNVSAALLVSGIFGLINEYLLKNTLVDLIFEKLNLKSSIDKTGVEEIHHDINNLDFSYYINNSRDEIDIFHVYGRTWTNTYSERISKKLESSNCKVRIILMSPDSEFIPALATHFGDTPEQLKKKIEEVTATWIRIKTNLMQSRKSKKRTQSNLNIYYHNGFPAHSIYRFDEKLIFISSKLTQEKTQNLPSIICTNTKKTDDLYDLHAKQIESILSNHSTPVDG